MRFLFLITLSLFSMLSFSISAMYEEDEQTENTGLWNVYAPSIAKGYLVNRFGPEISEKPIEVARESIKNTHPAVKLALLEHASIDQLFALKLAYLPPEIHYRIFEDQIFKGDEEACHKFYGMPYKDALLRLSWAAQDERDYPLRFFTFGERFKARSNNLLTLYKKLDKNIRRNRVPHLTNDEEHILVTQIPKSVRTWLKKRTFYCQRPLKDRFDIALEEGIWSGIIVLGDITSSKPILDFFSKTSSISQLTKYILKTLQPSLCLLLMDVAINNIPHYSFSFGQAAWLCYSIAPYGNYAFNATMEGLSAANILKNILSQTFVTATSVDSIALGLAGASIGSIHSFKKSSREYPLHKKIQKRSMVIID